MIGHVKRTSKSSSHKWRGKESEGPIGATHE